MKKLNQLIKLFLSTNIKLSNISNNNNNFELKKYWYNNFNSLNNKYLNFNKKEKNNKREKSDKDKSIIFLFFSALKLVKLS